MQRLLVVVEDTVRCTLCGKASVELCILLGKDHEGYDVAMRSAMRDTDLEENHRSMLMMSWSFRHAILSCQHLEQEHRLLVLGRNSEGSCSRMWLETVENSSRRVPSKLAVWHRRKGDLTVANRISYCHEITRAGPSIDASPLY